MLRPLHDRKSLVVLGMNSGTSADGLDLAALRITQLAGSHRPGLRFQFLDGQTTSYPEDIRSLIIEAADTPNISVDRIILLDNLLGQFFGSAAARYVRKLSRKGLTIDAIASHGQTVRHLPQLTKLAGLRIRGTLQIGGLAHIAARSGLVTVGDFRQGDIALGGEGAPITVAATAELFSHATETRLIVNVGGMSNFFYLPPIARSGAGIRAADCGPGNVLSDLLCRILFHESFDRNGDRAASGAVSQRLLSIILASPFYLGSRRSTGREEFGEKLVRRILEGGQRLRLKPNDLIATAMDATAASIALAVRSFVNGRRDRSGVRLYLTGGGAHNRFLKSRLAERLPAVTVTTVAELGFDPDLVEASAYAVMGAFTLWSRPMRTRFDGAIQRRQAVLGTIGQPPVEALKKMR